ncbi:unnamed protein product [Bursaphelenchus okinawaensis]|uniref:CUB domain-containing protein n=1 Tax=Bursaphelenchus okinawaensis TaxID=465554 RepID=A0A811JT27_9BILA|nr:unnamed protein product [Bursaphelenchus okinawaensis]CAG9081266.1 unnamed protein product [Bursaphelenchus okinawaensis]
MATLLAALLLIVTVFCSAVKDDLPGISTKLSDEDDESNRVPDVTALNDVGIHAIEQSSANSPKSDPIDQTIKETSTSTESSTTEFLTKPTESPSNDIISQEPKTFWLCQSDVPAAEWTGTELRTPPPNQQHVAILAEPTEKAEIDIGENGTIPFRALQSIGYQAVQCTLRLEACADCFVSIELDSVRPYFTQFQVEKVSRCDDPTSAMADPCFVMDFIEERADVYRAADRPNYKKISAWNWPEKRVYNSTSHSLTIHLVMRNIDNSNQLFNYLLRLFPIQISVHRNTEYKDNFSFDHMISSPRYPEAYPRHMIKNYTIENKNEWGKVKLIFDDFLVDYQSSLRIFDSDETELFNSQNTHRRPPAILSNGPKLTILFVSGSFTHLVGFRARFEFVKEFTDWRNLPSENCDQIRESFGGQINLANKSELVGKYVDCIWIVGRLPSFAQVFDQVYLKIDKFEPNEAKDLKLEIRKGLHSTSPVILSLESMNFRTGSNRKYPVSLVNDQHPHPAFYIRLNGLLHISSDVQLTYSLFYRWATASCPGRFEFHCENSRCISDSLRCDGVDNCGDQSDEICEINPLLNMEKENDVAMLMAIVLSLAGIILTLSAMIALAVGLNRRKLMLTCTHRGDTTTEDSQNSSNSNQIGLSPSVHTVGDRRFYLLPEAGVSVIEAPPTYADALKHGFDRRGSYENGAFQYQRDDSDKDDDSSSHSVRISTGRDGSIQARVRFVDECSQENLQNPSNHNSQNNVKEATKDGKLSSKKSDEKLRKDNDKPTDTTSSTVILQETESKNDDKSENTEGEPSTVSSKPSEVQESPRSTEGNQQPSSITPTPRSLEDTKPRDKTKVHKIVPTGTKSRIKPKVVPLPSTSSESKRVTEIPIVVTTSEDTSEAQTNDVLI